MTVYHTPPQATPFVVGTSFWCKPQISLPIHDNITRTSLRARPRHCREKKALSPLENAWYHCSHDKSQPGDPGANMENASFRRGQSGQRGLWKQHGHVRLVSSDSGGCLIAQGASNPIIRQQWCPFDGAKLAHRRAPLRHHRGMPEKKLVNITGSGSSLRLPLIIIIIIIHQYLLKTGHSLLSKSLTSFNRGFCLLVLSYYERSSACHTVSKYINGWLNEYLNNHSKMFLFF